MSYEEAADFDEKRNYVRDLLLYLEPVASNLSDWSALEIGGGGGMLAGLLAPHFKTVLSTDIFNTNTSSGGRMYGLLEEKFARNGETFDVSKVEFLACDAQNLPFRDNWFDICFSQNAFEHIPDPELAFREAVRVTKPGGFVYFQFDPVWTADSGSHFLARIGEPWAHLINDDDTLIAMMTEAGAPEEEIEDFRSAMNRLPISYYREMLPRVIRQNRLEIVIFHEWAGTIDPLWTDHPNLGKAAAALGLPPEDLLVRGIRYLLRKPTIR